MFSLQGRLIVVLTVLFSWRQFHFLSRNFSVRDLAQEVRNAVEPCGFFIVRAHDKPGSIFGVRGLHHEVSRFGIFVPAAVGVEVHRAQLPLAEWVLDA